MEKEENNVYVGFKNNGNEFNYVLSRAFKEYLKNKKMNEEFIKTIKNDNQRKYDYIN